MAPGAQAPRGGRYAGWPAAFSCPARSHNTARWIVNGEQSTRRPPQPPGPQKNLERATQLAFDKLEGQTREQLVWLGAEPTATGCRLRVLDDWFEVDLQTRRVVLPGGRPVRPHWGILALHYLAVRTRPERLAPEVTFADLAAARSYASVYDGRVIGRLCGTVGREAEMLQTAAKRLGGHRALGGDLAFDFDVFPRVNLRLVWHEPDEEFPPSATLLLPANIEEYFCAEDIVVLSESLVARLAGRPF
ncbi:MAG TPA: DUF3786 domain-containing protein [Planctomycetes bacterium]|nr:DUF3786 domain-containing protein [Planctomycetota bacterium]